MVDPQKSALDVQAQTRQHASSRTGKANDQAAIGYATAARSPLPPSAPLERDPAVTEGSVGARPVTSVVEPRVGLRRSRSWLSQLLLQASWANRAAQPWCGTILRRYVVDG